MRVSEKTLELNLAAEMLQIIRGYDGHAKAYLRGLTQTQESEDGPDSYLQLPPETRLFAFQFKAATLDDPAYTFRLAKKQHNALKDLADSAQLPHGSVVYVFPYCREYTKFESDLPELISDTWTLDVADMPSAQEMFGDRKKKMVFCDDQHWAHWNPRVGLTRMAEHLELSLPSGGIARDGFVEWYRSLQSASRAGRRNPWLFRGLRMAVLIPQGADCRRFQPLGEEITES